MKNLITKMRTKNDGFLIVDATNFKGKWKKDVFSNRKGDYPILLEIGSKNGEFLISTNMINNNLNLIGIEGNTVFLEKSFKTVNSLFKAGRELHNLKLINGDFSKVDQYFTDGEIDLIRISYPIININNRDGKDILSVAKLSFDSLRKFIGVLAINGTMEILTEDKRIYEKALENIEKFSHITKGEELITVKSEDAYTENKYEPKTNTEIIAKNNNEKLFFIKITKPETMRDVKFNNF